MGLMNLMERLLMEMEARKKSDAFTQEYWVNLNSDIKDIVHNFDFSWGFEWAVDAYNLLKDDGKEFLFVIEANDEHMWIEHRSLRRGRFIADGLAGQYDPVYPNGYYGLVKDAPVKLREIYENRDKH
ncbi:MAG: hypothetical protein AABX51_06860 [Nanoarchaeota archaeon]